MTAPADWLTDRPELPSRREMADQIAAVNRGDWPPSPEPTPLLSEVLADVRRKMQDREEQDRTAVLYRVEELRELLEPEPEPAWPTEEPDAPTVQIAVKPQRWSLRGIRKRMTLPRILAGGASGLVLLAGFLGWVQ